MIKKTKINLISLVFLSVLVVLFSSCSFEQIVTTLGKTGQNYLTGSANANANATSAVESCNSVIDTLKGQITGGINNQSVWEIIEESVNSENENVEFLDRCKGILGAVAISDEDYANVLKDISKASFSDESLKKFVSDLTSSSIPLSELVDPNGDGEVSIIDKVKTGLKTVVDKYIEDGENQASEVTAMSTISNFIDSAFEEAQSVLDSTDVDSTDLLMLSMVARTAVNAIDLICSAGDELNSDTLTAIIGGEDGQKLVSQSLGLLQIAGSIERGCTLNDKKPSAVVSAFAGLNELFNDILNAGVV